MGWRPRDRGAHCGVGAIATLPRGPALPLLAFWLTAVCGPARMEFKPVRSLSCWKAGWTRGGGGHSSDWTHPVARDDEHRAPYSDDHPRTPAVRFQYGDFTPILRRMSPTAFQIDDRDESSVSCHSRLCRPRPLPCRVHRAIRAVPPRPVRVTGPALKGAHNRHAAADSRVGSFEPSVGRGDATDRPTAAPLPLRHRRCDAAPAAGDHPALRRRSPLACGEGDQGAFVRSSVTALHPAGPLPHFVHRAIWAHSPHSAPPLQG